MVLSFRLLPGLVDLDDHAIIADGQASQPESTHVDALEEALVVMVAARLRG